MLLAVDIGNTNIVFGIWSENAWKHHWRLPTLPADQMPYYELEFSNLMLENNVEANFTGGIVMSSVVPDLTSGFLELLANLTSTVVRNLDPEHMQRLPIQISKPYEIGPDLAANAFAAARKYGPSLVVDFGTALSFTLVDPHQGITGVTIAPGIRTMMQTLAGKTARLPEVPLVLPSSAIGHDTPGAIQAGLLYGSIGMIREISARMRAEYGQKVKFIATGGLSSVLGEFMREFDAVDHMLTLDGLRFFHEHVSQDNEH